MGRLLCGTDLNTAVKSVRILIYIALSQILETVVLYIVVTFHFSGGKVYSMNKGCHTCMIKHTMHVQSVHCSARCVYIRA